MKETEERQTVRFGEDWVDMGLFTYAEPTSRQRPVAKFNPHHDRLGRFASAGAGEGPGSFGGGGSKSTPHDQMFDAQYPSVSLSRSHRMTVNTLAHRVLTSPMVARGAIAAEETTKDGVNLNVLWPAPYVEVRVSAYHREREMYAEKTIAVDAISAKNRIGVGLESVLNEVAGVAKFNPHHDAKGRFASKAMTAEFGALPFATQNPLNERETVLDQGGLRAGVTLIEYPDRVHVKDLRAMSRGGGRKAMEQVVSLADKHGVTLSLLAVPYAATPGGGKKMSSKELQEWYRGFGFEGTTSMTRAPGGGAAPRATPTPSRSGVLRLGGSMRVVDFSSSTDDYDE